MRWALSVNRINSLPKQGIRLDISQRIHMKYQALFGFLKLEQNLKSNSSRSFVEIDHEIISTVILLPSAKSFMKGCCHLQAFKWALLFLFFLLF